jgi:hypothetical protein
VWTLNEKDIDFADLNKDQVCNHYEGITSLTTKRGFSDLLRDMHWNNEDALDCAPRCYNLGDPTHRDEFIDDFRIVAATNILKWYVLHSGPQLGGSFFPCKACYSSATGGGTTLAHHWEWVDSKVDKKTLDLAVIACLWYIRVHAYGEYPGVDISR